MVDDAYRDVEKGHPGELVVRGPTVSPGYYNNKVETSKAFHDGWFCTGDIAVYRDGGFYIVDRKKELIKYKGLQIAPAELEQLLNTHPLIRESAVIGVPANDDTSSEIPRAYVVADPTKISGEEIKAFVRGRLAPYKQLRGGVVFVDNIPKSPIGKILRRELRDTVKTEICLQHKSKL